MTWIARLERLANTYKTTAIIAVNTVLTFVMLNLVIWAAFLIVDGVALTRNVVESKYGASALAAVYPGWSQSDIRQLLDEIWGRPLGYQPYVQFREASFKGKFVNIEEAGFRHSANQAPWPPPIDAFTVFVFGGSTTFGYGLPDAETVPSQIQRLLHDRGHQRAAIYNFGAGSYQSTQERILFQELLAQGYRPHLAIFIDGLNEFAFPHVPRDTESLIRIVGDAGAIRKRLVSRLLDEIPVMRLARALGADQAPGSAVPETPGGGGSQGLIESVVARYFSNIAQIGAVARAAGVTPVFVWQPVPYFNYDTRHHPFFNPGATNQHAAAAYAYVKTHVGRTAVDPTFLWAADLQEGLAEPLYVDSVHYTAAMSHRFARWIVNRILDAGLVPVVN